MKIERTDTPPISIDLCEYIKKIDDLEKATQELVERIKFLEQQSNVLTIVKDNEND